MTQGTVKFFWIHKGYGFITPDDHGKDVFVDRSELEKTGLMSLNAGQKVTFDVDPDKKPGRLRAVNVRIAG
jgi:cold shock protein